MDEHFRQFLDTLTHHFNTVQEFTDFLAANLRALVIQRCAQGTTPQARAWRQASDFLVAHLHAGRILSVELVDQAVRLAEVHLGQIPLDVKVQHNQVTDPKDKKIQQLEKELARYKNPKKDGGADDPPKDPPKDPPRGGGGGRGHHGQRGRGGGGGRGSSAGGGRGGSSPPDPTSKPAPVDPLAAERKRIHEQRRQLEEDERRLKEQDMAAAQRSADRALLRFAEYYDGRDGGDQGDPGVNSQYMVPPYSCRGSACASSPPTFHSLHSEVLSHPAAQDLGWCVDSGAMKGGTNRKECV